jgi:hypothetical protein
MKGGDAIQSQSEEEYSQSTGMEEDQNMVTCEEICTD